MRTWAQVASADSVLAARELLVASFTFTATGDKDHRVYYGSKAKMDRNERAGDKEAHKLWMMDIFNKDNLDRPYIIERLDQRIVKVGMALADTTRSLLERRAAPLAVEVENWTYDFVEGGGHRFHLDTRWKLRDAISDSTVWDTLTHSVSLFQDTSVFDHANSFIDALIKGIDGVLTNDRLRGYLKDKDGPFSPAYARWPFLDLPGPAPMPTRVNDALRSVVTITQGDEQCSGVMVSSDGHILTTTRLINADTEVPLEVVFSDGSRLPAVRMRMNPRSDLGLLKVDRPGSIAIPMDTAYVAELGDPVYAISTPHTVQLGQSVSHGIISGSRVFEGQRYLQTDVGIGPGSKGGALLNEKGMLIGILVGKVSGHGVEGIGFAIPADRIPSDLKLTLPR